MERLFPLSVVVAAMNEEEGIKPTILELQEHLEHPQLVVVDGNSTDHTIDIAKSLGAQVFLQKGSGKGNAISQGIENIDKDTKFVVFTDADFTYPASYVKEMISIMDSNPKIGMVLGNRFDKRYENESDRNQFYIGNRILAFIQRIVNGVHLKDPYTGLRIIRFELFRNWKPKSQGFDIESELNHFVNKNGFKIVEVPIRYRKRLGQKKLSFRHGLNIFRRIIIQAISAETTKNSEKIEITIH